MMKRGRMTDNGKDGFGECIKMNSIVNGLGSNTRILVASIRDAKTIADLAIDGLDTYTFSPAVARELFDEPLTDKAAEDFEGAASRGGMEGGQEVAEEEKVDSPKMTATIRINGKILGRK